MSITAAYLRVSTEQQLHGAGPMQQRDNLVAYAVQHGIKVDIWATDDETGTTADREKIQWLLSEAREGRLQTLLVDRLDRLGRKMHVCESLYEAFTAAGCQVRFVAAHFENNAAGTLMRQIMSSFAEYQRTELLQRMQQCKRAKAARLGLYSRCITPYGYRLDSTGGMEENPEEAAAVRIAARMRAEGASLRDIATRLHADGFLSRSKRNTWSATQVKRILDNLPKYRAEQPFVEGAEVRQPNIIY